MPQAIAVEELSAEHFEALVGERLRVHEAELELVEVERQPQCTLPRARRTNFALLLRLVHGEPFETGHYPIAHERIEPAEPVLLKRVMPPMEHVEPGVFGGPAFYEVLFN